MKLIFRKFQREGLLQQISKGCKPNEIMTSFAVYNGKKNWKVQKDIIIKVVTKKIKRFIINLL